MIRKTPQGPHIEKVDKAHLIPSPGGSNPQLLPKGELEEEQGHPHHQQHHQEGNDERPWEEMRLKIGKQSLIEAMIVKAMMKGPDAQMVWRKVWRKRHPVLPAMRQDRKIHFLGLFRRHVPASCCTRSTSCSPSMLFRSEVPLNIWKCQLNVLRQDLKNQIVFHLIFLNIK